ncbi:MFS transporter [Alcanivorax sp. 97CO-5]|jgi:phosphoserine aminotransferase|uniref:3-phosphoserine/phosphohydroxythreonine transaminase n=1 Tax=Alcanivorax TaxID=59753 RepID=UPI0003E7F80E|nr:MULTISPECIES: 3-phosphoserine/phosphohydroxythreonine transaminase [unclassified Alcanivorax]EUC69476.1 MFS transporter [Alcanivorax sp. 97CO-5]PKG01388.1 3-phosphoserine/phosphohydroxythreonine transaminase [Alcanivorax sp. 97CO-6]BAP14656.1 phosphoserine aminotransferase [Alcanivorax sp. NBRC 101098]
MSRAYNFCAGPAALPQAVLEQAQQEMLDYRGLGLSIMEMSHRDNVFVEIAEQAEKDLRDLMGISDDYAVLFLQGGASSQFAMVPMNLLGDGETADYINTGQWSKKAIKEAGRYGNINVAASSEDTNFSTVPPQESWNLSDNPAYVHYCPNETIGGLEYSFVPQVGDTPLVADMSSTILSRPIDVNQYGLIYAGAQKNIGPAGLTLVVIRKDLLGKAANNVPAMLNYQTHADNDSMYNTPPTFAWYLSGLVFSWLKKQGGVGNMGEINQRKAEKLYHFIDHSGLYSNPVEVISRSRMNVPFVLADDRLDKPFLDQAQAAGLLNLKGHRSVGGMRASIYNAVPEAAVDALIDFMAEFEKKNA